MTVVCWPFPQLGKDVRTDLEEFQACEEEWSSGSPQVACFCWETAEFLSLEGVTPLVSTQVAQGPVLTSLDHFQNWSVHSFSGQPVLVLYHLHGEEFLAKGYDKIVHQA